MRSRVLPALFGLTLAALLLLGQCTEGWTQSGTTHKKEHDVDYVRETTTWDRARMIMGLTIDQCWIDYQDPETKTETYLLCAKAYITRAIQQERAKEQKADGTGTSR